MFQSFRGAPSANLRCAIAHRGISRFPDAPIAHLWSGPSKSAVADLDIDVAELG